MSYFVTAGEDIAITLNETNDTASILQNVAMILGTPKGSVPMYRDFGVRIEALDRPVPVAKIMLRSEVKEAVELYEPRVEVVDVTFEQDRADPSHLIPTVEVEIINEEP